MTEFEINADYERRLSAWRRRIPADLALFLVAAILAALALTWFGPLFAAAMQSIDPAATWRNTALTGSLVDRLPESALLAAALIGPPLVLILARRPRRRDPQDIALDRAVDRALDEMKNERAR